MNNCHFVIIACYPDRGMKSYGSKSLLAFNDKKLIDYQLMWISKSKKYDNISIIVDFDINRVQKNFNYDIDIIELNGQNPIVLACEKFRDKNICFIDYGCIFNKNLLPSLTFETSEIMCLSGISKNNNLDVGCVINDGYIENMFLDLPNNKFCNIFSLIQQDVQKITTNTTKSNNLLYFEIINSLIQTGSKVKPIYINSFLYFNSMRQKNAVNKFIKKNN